MKVKLSFIDRSQTANELNREATVARILGDYPKCRS